MPHADLGGIAGETVGQRRDEGVDGAAAHDRVDHGAAVGAQHAALVGHLDVRRPLPHEVDELRGPGAEERVLPVQPEAADVVVARVDLREQLRNLLGRILQVGVERDDDVAAHPLERRHDRHVLAVVGVEIDDAGDVGPRGVLGAEQFERPVGAAVVGEDDLVGPAEPVEHGVEAGEERRQVRLLVVDGDDDRETGAG